MCETQSCTNHTLSLGKNRHLHHPWPICQPTRCQPRPGRPWSSSLARSALVRWALHFSTESTCASLPTPRRSRPDLAPHVRHVAFVQRCTTSLPVLAQSEISSDRDKACRRAQSSLCTGSVTLHTPTRERLRRPAPLPSHLASLRSVLAQERAIHKQLPSKTVSRTFGCIQKCAVPSCGCTLCASGLSPTSVCYQ